MKHQINIRASELLQRQLAELTNQLRTSITETVSLAIDRMYREEIATMTYGTKSLIEATGPADFTVTMGHAYHGRPTGHMTDHYTVEYWLTLTPEGIANPDSRLPQDVPPVYYTIAADDLADARRHFRRTHEYLVRMAAACPNPLVALERMQKTIPLLPLKPMDCSIFHQEFRQHETA